MRQFSLCVIWGAAVLVAACNQQPPAVVQAAPAKETAIDQANLCETSSWQHDIVARVCKPGQKVAFLPERWGNVQLPIMFAAVNCDLRYGVVHTDGAVTCIYGPITPQPVAAAEKPAGVGSVPSGKP